MDRSVTRRATRLHVWLRDTTLAALTGALLGSCGFPEYSTAGSASCSDQRADGDETDVDCGGSCGRCPTRATCQADADCESGVCDLGRCAAPTCADGVKNASESDTDCGSSCNACTVDQKCADADGLDVDANCDSGLCKHGRCQAPACDDGQKNGDESDADCGGSTCSRCPDGKACRKSSDCLNGSCAAGKCVPSQCGNGLQDKGETGPDCGGSACAPCADNLGCSVDADCASMVCRQLLCAAASCNDQRKNGDETDTDCGGACLACRNGLGCKANTDCQSGVCGGGVCQSAGCEDGQRNGRETDVDCGGGDCPSCGPERACTSDDDCATAACVNLKCAPKLSVQIKNNNAVTNPSLIQPFIRLVNASASDMPLSDFSVRYYFTLEHQGKLVYDCYSLIDVDHCSSLVARFVTINPPRPNAGVFLELTFSTAADVVIPAAGFVEVGGGFHFDPQVSAFDTSNDYSFSYNTAFGETTTMTLYRHGTLVSGVEPPAQ